MENFFKKYKIHNMKFKKKISEEQLVALRESISKANDTISMRRMQAVTILEKSLSAAAIKIFASGLYPGRFFVGNN